MKTKTLQKFLAAIAVLALILAGCENPDGSCNLAWSLSFIGISCFSAFGYSALEKEDGK